MGNAISSEFTLRELKKLNPEAVRNYSRMVSLRHVRRYRDAYPGISRPKRLALGLSLRQKRTKTERRLIKRQQRRRRCLLPEYKAKESRRMKLWKQRNRDKVLAYNKRYDLAHPEKRNLRNLLGWHRRRSKRELRFTPSQLIKRLSMFAGCWICGGAKEEMDHVKPVSRGGLHCLSNIRPVCGPCNKRKTNKWPLSLMAQQSPTGV